MALNKERALERLQRSIDQIGDVSRNRRLSPVYTKWRRDTQVAIENTFGLGSRHIKDFDAVRYSPGSFSDSTPESYFDERFQKGLEEARVVLQSMIDEIKEYWDDETPSRTLMPSLAIPDVTTNKIFLVHGHDAGLKEQVARFLEKIGLEPIVLHEQPDAGRTIIEKFEQNADVPFAIAIFTPDDEGRRKGTQKFAPRARQNVLFEFGYLSGVSDGSELSP